MAALLVLAAGPAVADVPIAVSAFPVTGGAAPDAITQGPDGALWFTEPAVSEVGRVTPAGAFSEFSVGANSRPGAITVGPDGALWFVQPGTEQVGRISTAGAVREVSIAVGSCSAGLGSDPVGIASGSNGDLWVTEARDSPGEIAEIDPTSDSVTQNCLSYDLPYAITAGSDGALWFTYDSQYIGRITTAGSSGAIAASSVSTQQMPIVSGPDGNLWVGITGSPSTLDRVTVGDVLTPFSFPSGVAASAERIGVGPDGQLWLAGGGELTSVTTAGAFAQFSGIYPSADTIAGIAAGPNDTLWLTDSSTSTIYRVSLGTPSIAAALSPIAGVTESSAVVSGTLSVPAGQLDQSASYSFEYGSTTAYGTSTAPATTTVTPAGTTVSATLTNLAPNTTYHYRLLATGCSPSSCAASTGDQSFTTGLSLVPVEGVTVAVAPVTGRVLIRLRGQKRSRLLGAGELIPVGSTINAKHGHVLIESAVAGAPQAVASGIFFGGTFVVTQPTGAPTTVLELRSNLAVCRARRARAHRATTARASKSHKVVDQVFGTAHGQYTTRGHYAAAADEGTAWLTSDRCDGTYVAVQLGQVDVTDLVRNTTFALSAGQHYLASPR